MGLIKDILYELRAILESLCGKKTVKSWLDSVSDSADHIIKNIEKKDDVRYCDGELIIEIGEHVIAVISLNFKDKESKIVNYETERKFEKRKFVSRELDMAFGDKKRIVYPIDGPESK